MVQPDIKKQSWESKKPIRVLSKDSHPSRTHPELLVRGTDTWNARLTMDIARDIRQRVIEGVAKKALAREFNVDPSLIRQICRYEIWKE